MVKSFLEFQSQKKYSMEDSIDRVMLSPIGKKKLYLTFPKDNFEEFAYRIAKKLGIITCFFHNVEEANRELQRIKKTGFKADEIVIQTHGNLGELVITMEDPNFSTGGNKWESFLENIRGIINPNSKVIFTACYGAYYLYRIKQAAETLGCRVYASQGKYYPFRNYSEEGWYYCNPIPKTTEKTRFSDNETFLKNKMCSSCETPIGWLNLLIPSGH